MCLKNNVTLDELVDLYKLKLRKEMNEAYCSARDYPPSVVTVLEQQNKGKREEFWTPEWRKYKKTIYRTAKENVLKFEKVAFPGVVMDPRGGKRIENTTEVHNKPKDNKRGRRMFDTQERMSDTQNVTSQNIPCQGSFHKMPLDITFKLRMQPRLTFPATTLEQAIFDEMIKYFELTRAQYNEILDNVKERYPDMIMRERENEEQDVEEEDDDVKESDDVKEDDEVKEDDDDKEDDDVKKDEDDKEHDDDDYDEEDDHDKDDDDDEDDEDDDSEMDDYDPNVDGIDDYDEDSDDAKMKERIRQRYPQMTIYKYSQYRLKKFRNSNKSIPELNKPSTIPSYQPTGQPSEEHSGVRLSKRQRIKNSNLKDYVL